MTANIAQPIVTYTSSPDAIRLAPAASCASTLTSLSECGNCSKNASVMLCEVYSYRKGIHDDGRPQLVYTSERCSVCPFERCA